jgi:1-acyl-sn-glycerol-3-phosphate acyltransferase
MPISEPKVDELSRSLIQEIFTAFSIPRRSLTRRLLAPLLWLPAHRFSRLMARVDQEIGQGGIRQGTRWLLTQVVDSARVSGAETIPADGPLIIASNHPGTYDSLVICSALPRDDLKILVSGVPFVRALPASQPYLIFVTSEVPTRMAALRAAIDHLRAGGALLIFPSGTYDPDPALNKEGALKALELWSPSLDLFLRKVPATRAVLATASGVLAESCLRHPVVRLASRGRRGLNSQKLAEFVQLIQQMVFGIRYPLQPRVTFGVPFVPTEVARQAGMDSCLELLIQEAKELLEVHLEQLDETKALPFGSQSVPGSTV